MSCYVWPVAFSLFVWWFSTGLILWLNHRPVWTFRYSLGAGVGVFVAAAYALWASATDTSAAGVYTAFTAAVLIWGLHQMSFYMGAITGPRRGARATGSRGWRHFIEALLTCLWHELAVLATAAALIAVTWRQPNQVGTWSFLLLWGMHVSAKLNVFLGVLNLNEAFLPPHMKYLGGYLSTRPMNLLFPLSVTLGCVLGVVWGQRALAAETVGGAAGYVFLTTMTALAVLEHWFLVLPLPADALWRWSLRKGTGANETNGEAPKARDRDPTAAIA